MANADDVVKDAMAVVTKLAETHEVLSSSIERELPPNGDYQGFAAHGGSGSVRDRKSTVINGETHD